ncbi:tetratricopeptide repeat protein [Pseudobacteriovorax antillogorgiicola]|uniref:Tetratricopeptide repeat-containing protein n=1 Tax=Pseudobacteriovorax antillogorgiicola TaxID=1513793 RepID=A0A1Y6CBV5_9BACT|nr:tetratricopeptide repeat protein [Pseudobacteriovorax antillogorgiicola]TCS49429.1 tetratricopeptide repeat protein [Pseudobacteriovorax antillogorgiicola]SMF46706.1 Tetratricopeptide repeat-containing protein [Pseudobacteriovorax antillogorgiicola]
MNLNDPNQKLEYANKLIFVKEYKKAQKIIEELIRHDSFTHNLLVHLRRIELAVKLENLETLKVEYERATEKNPDNANSKICHILVEQHGEMIKPEEAVIRFQSLLRIVGPHPAIYYGIGFSMEMEGNFERALFNYEQCTTCDHGWYPGYFGMSQIYYHLGDDEKGDHYFFMFEELAPYNVYGNFETHRKLSHEFVQDEEFESAERAIISLSEWWMDNKGFCPIEIQIYERFSTAKIADLAGDQHRAEQRRSQGELLARRAMESEDEPETVLYFIAKTLEEFSELNMALEFYKEILSREASSPDMVQKIGSQFLSVGEYELANEIFETAYHHHPDHPEIRFCWMVSKLRRSGVNVEEYLIDKERLRALLENQSDKVELLSLLHSLMAKYGQDPDVQGHMGDVYLRLGNQDRAAKHYEKMYEIDGKSLVTKLKYASYQMQFGDIELAKQILDQISEVDLEDSSDQKSELLWLKSNYAYQTEDYRKGLDYLNQVLKHDPWHVAYLVQKALTLSALAQDKVSFNLYDSVLKKLSKNDEEGLDWDEFTRKSTMIAQANLLELDYCRCKIRFLYANGDERNLVALVHAACKLDPGKTTYDFLKLLNTNFDSPNIYWALGQLYKELWQLEAASVWFEQILISLDATDDHKAKAYQELADCFIWRGVMIDRAVEYAKIALDMSNEGREATLRTLAHSLLKKGEVRQAEVYLDELEDEDPEVIYLKGLVHYRNGAAGQANEVWKPLLSLPADRLRLHTIKQQVMKYYFDKVPYKTIN